MVKRKLIPIVVVLLVLASSGLVVWHFHDRNTTPADALILYGNIDIRQVQLAFDGSERIATMLVKEGDAVKKGQLLATLDTDRLQHAVALQRAQAAAQRHVLQRLKAGSRPEEISKAEADVEAARIEAENAERIYQRQKQLVADHFVAAQQADNARAAADAAEARYRAARDALKLVKLGPRKEDIAAARASLQASLAALASAKTALADASLHAPADGIIQQRILEPGDMASPQRPVYTLALTDPLWARVYVDESSLGKLKPGMPADVTTDSYPGKHYHAWVGYISPTAEFTPKSVETTAVRSSLVYQVRVFVCNSGNELRMGMPATVTIPLKAAATSADTSCPHS